MADGGPWLMSLGGGCALVVEADGIWKQTMEGERGIPMSFQTQNQTNLISFLMYLGFVSNLLSSPHTQTAQNNTRLIPLGAALKNETQVRQQIPLKIYK